MNQMNQPPAVPIGIQSTAGAVPIRNEKGEVSMKKVKVQRYISGKKPEYAAGVSSEDESDEEDFIQQQKTDRHIPDKPNEVEKEEDEPEDPRLARLRAARAAGPAARHEHEPEVMELDSEGEGGSEGSEDAAGSSESEDELDEEEIERRRQALKAKLANREKAEEEEVLGRGDEDDMPEADKDESGSSDTEYTDSEDDRGPRVKPVFVRASERMTVAEKDKKQKQAKREEAESRKEKEERRREALKLVEDTIRAEQAFKQGEQREGKINDVCTDDENDELEYEAWKLREMKRIKRDKEEREMYEKEMLEIERLRNMTEEERRNELRLNPKVVTNKAAKGKYKFLQKYYHRGAFYLDKEEEVLKQDFSGATLEDHFDKSVLPKVMQVKKFGRSGRTKYTHLVDQDTTEFDSPWSGEAVPHKLQSSSRAGMKQVFQRPSAKRKH